MNSFRLILSVSICALSLGCAQTASHRPMTTISAPQTAALPAPQCNSKSTFSFAVHGGVGTKGSKEQSDVIARVLTEAHKLLQAGHAGIDVAQFAIETMEDSGLFNAGRGGTRTNANTVELDASIMDGRTLAAGAVASVKDVKNPIRLARAVKEKTKHVLIVGAGASLLADELGLEKVGPSYFTAPAFQKKDSSFSRNERDGKTHFGTVGAVTLDRCGDLSAATSSGGLTGKRQGRVGDSPIIGAGTYANNATSAVSATGEGEKFIRANVAARISNILQYTKRNLRSAVDETLDLVQKIDGGGGVIAIDAKGNFVSSSTHKDPMPSGFVKEDGRLILRDLTLQ